MIRSTKLIKKNSNQIQSANLNVFVWGSLSKLAVFHKHHRSGQLVPFWRRTIPKLQITLLLCSPKPNVFEAIPYAMFNYTAGRLTSIEPENDAFGSDVFPFPKGGPNSLVPCYASGLHKILSFRTCIHWRTNRRSSRSTCLRQPVVTVMSMVLLDFFVWHGLVSSPLQTSTSQKIITS